MRPRTERSSRTVALPARETPIGCDRTRQTGRDVLDVASGLPVSSIACKDDARRVGEPRAPPNRTTSPLGSFTDEPAPAGRRIRFPSSSARTHRPSGDNAPPPLLSPSETAGEPSVLSSKHRGVPCEGPAGQSIEKDQRPAVGRQSADDGLHEPTEIALARFPRGLAGGVDPNRVSRQQHPAVR